MPIMYEYFDQSSYDQPIKRQIYPGYFRTKADLSINHMFYISENYALLSDSWTGSSNTQNLTYYQVRPDLNQVQNYVLNLKYS